MSLGGRGGWNPQPLDPADPGSVVDYPPLIQNLHWDGVELGGPMFPLNPGVVVFPSYVEGETVLHHTTSYLSQYIAVVFIPVL